MAENIEHNTFAAAKKSVFTYLKYRARSEQEIIRKMCFKGFSDDIIRETVTYFKKIGSIDDALFARGWTGSRINKPVGIRQIKAELKQKGISDELINEAVNHAVQGYEEHEVVLHLARQQLAKYRHLEKNKARRRLYEFLSRRGFSVDSIIKVINNLT